MTRRVEHDLLGEREVPRDVYWGIHTLRAKENFDVSGHTIHPELIRALAQVKKSCARANMDLGYLAEDTGQAIVASCEEIIEGRLHDQFVVDVFQGGAGTSTHMNANEEVCRELVDRGWRNWGLPALVPYIGYDKATDIARQAARDGMTAREVILSAGMFTEEELDAVLRKGVTAFDRDDFFAGY